MEEILNIVIADDNKAIVEMMKKSIEEDKRYKVIGVAIDDESEIEIIDKLKPDIVITDLKKGNGWTGLKIIEKYLEEEYQPVFFIISASAISSIDDIRRLHIRHYLNKPYDTDDLKRKLNDIYDEFFPKAMIEPKASFMEKKERNFLKKLVNVLKKRIG